MGRKRSTKKEPLTKVQRDHNRGQFLNRIRTMMYARTIGMAPFPYEPRTFYRMVWGEARMEAMAALPIDMFDLQDTVMVHSTESEHRDTRPYCALRVRLGMKLPHQKSAVLVDDCLSIEDRGILNAWARLRLRLMDERDQIVGATEGILNTAVTYGQIKAFWPTVEKFMPSEVQESMRSFQNSRPSPSMYKAWEEKTKHRPGDVELMLVEAAMFDTCDLNDPISILY